MALYRSRGSALAAAAGGELDRSQAELKRLLGVAREEGRQAGLREAAAALAEAKRMTEGVQGSLAAQKADLQAKLTPVFEALSASLAEVENLEAQLVQASEAEVVRLAVAIAERVVRAKVEHDPAWMREVLAEALRQIPDRRAVVIRMHPTDAGVAREHLNELGTRVPGLVKLEIVDDNGLQRGGCILQSLGTTLDAGVANAVGRLGERLLQAAPKPEGWVAVGQAGDAAGTGQ
jgi:flagellar biosynthesis/type III secretory pathway protein FliH